MDRREEVRSTIPDWKTWKLRIRSKGRGSPRIQSTFCSANFFSKSKPTNLLKAKEAVRNRTKRTHQIVENTNKYVKSLRMTKTARPEQRQIPGANQTLSGRWRKVRTSFRVLSFCFSGAAW